ncbi:MAG TPA: SPOR domain-containing protein [Rubrivivax sp.]|nr:SPOR domain-containing protein [Rubrivivax sp.]
MASSTFLKRKDKKPDAAMAGELPGEEAGPVQEARVRARRRLIGAVVLLAIGVIVFPLLFETQPRPLPGEVMIEMPRQGEAGTQAGARSSNSGVVTALPPGPGSPTPPPEPEVEPPAVDAAKAPASPGESAPADAVTAPPTTAEAPAASAPGRLAQSEPEKPAPARKSDGERARALLENRPVGAAAAPAGPSAVASVPAQSRFVVQVGAYSDAATLREVRSRVEKLGLKTYTQVVETPAGSRTRVRVGPFGNRAEADAASGKLQAAGLPGHILTL